MVGLNCVSLVWRGKFKDIFGGKDRGFICRECKGPNAKCRQQWLAIGLRSGGRNNFGRRGLCQLAHCAALPHMNMSSFYLLLYCDLVKKLHCKKSGGFRKIGRLRGLFGKFRVHGVPVDY